MARTSDRIKSRTKLCVRPRLYCSSNLMGNRKSKNRRRTTALRITKISCPGNRHLQDLDSNSDFASLRCSTRERRTVNCEDYTDSSVAKVKDIVRPAYKSLRNQMNNSFNQHKMLCYKRKRALKTTSTPGSEGLRPRRLTRAAVRQQLISESDDKQELAEEKVGQDETENGKVDGENDIDEDVEDEGNEDGDDEVGKEEQVGRRRYDLRNRPDVRRSSMAEGKIQPRSPQRVLYQGMCTKVNRGVKKGGSRVQKRYWLRPEYSDDSLIVDELDQHPAIPWGHGGSRPCQPWPFGGLDMHGITTWGLNVAASGWVHEGDAFSTSVTGVQTAGPSSKGGADIQPLQVVDSVSFDDIGGLSEYIDALKEMIFFPLLYPKFFASYHITPPRGVLLCGPPGTGKTLIARALACAASKAGQKVSFYMRKGADVLSKWVGEAERQLKLLFEEAQKNQPSIIFFDEIDGLAPVRSSKQEQIHNSIVSTLLALMDGLDSRGQVVLIGATNRIDAIDGALRRPGRFDREFNFPLPGCEARSEILDIHTRKWKHAPSDELRKELASSCVGYCGADLKALCTEAAIRAFREKYPQVYTSDDQFLIDVDSVKVEKYHFIEAMSTITPAAHRGAIVHSRPLSLVVRPCLCRHLEAAMGIISDIFLPVSVASESIKLSTHSFGRAIPLVYRPRLLLCGSEGTGLDHLGPAVLHELEKFPVFSLGISVLVSDSSAITPEEALIHIFNEARRTTPSILYLPQFDVWWETAHEQLRAVLQTLLEELPSDLPILLFGTSSVQLAEVKEVPISVFPHHSVYQVNTPSAEDRMLFFNDLVEAVLSAFSGIMNKKSLDTGCLSELPKAPKLARGPKASELKAKVEAEQHALRRLRMCLRDVCNKILYDKRYNLFHYPVSDEDAPNYHSIIQNPMDMGTMLQRVDNGWYITRSAFLQDIDLIVSNAKVYNGEDYNGARIVSRACQLRDVVHGMISQIDPALVAYCDKIAAQGGPVHLSNELRGSTFPATPVVQLGTATRSSARLHNVEPGVSVDQSYEALKHTKKSSDVARGEDKSGQDPLPSKSQTQSTDGNLHGTGTNGSVHGSSLEDATISDTELSTRLQSIKQLFVEHSDGYSIPQLESLYTRIMKRVSQTKLDCKTSALSFLLNFVEDGANF